MTILLVDDEENYLDLMSGALRRKGHTVVVARDGKQARESIDQDRPDLIISDVFMPTLDGARLHSYVRDFTDIPDVPFIFVSGHDDVTVRRLVVDERIDYFFTKSGPVESVLSLVDRLGAGRKVRAV